MINVYGITVQFLLAQDPENIFLQRGEVHSSMEQQNKVWKSLQLLFHDTHFLC